jgi:hypothetical protein
MPLERLSLSVILVSQPSSDLELLSLECQVCAKQIFFPSLFLHYIPLCC